MTCSQSPIAVEAGTEERRTKRTTGQRTGGKHREAPHPHSGCGQVCPLSLHLHLPERSSLSRVRCAAAPRTIRAPLTAPGRSETPLLREGKGGQCKGKTQRAFHGSASKGLPRPRGKPSPTQPHRTLNGPAGTKTHCIAGVPPGRPRPNQ